MLAVEMKQQPLTLLSYLAATESISFSLDSLFVHNKQCTVVHAFKLSVVRRNRPGKVQGANEICMRTNAAVMTS